MGANANQYDSNVEYRKSSQHRNADVLSRNPVGENSNFDREESGADIDTVCTVGMTSRQINPVDPGIITEKSASDPVLSIVIGYTRDGWPSDRENEKTDKSKKFVYVVNFLESYINHCQPTDDVFSTVRD